MVDFLFAQAILQPTTQTSVQHLFSLALLIFSCRILPCRLQLFLFLVVIDEYCPVDPRQLNCDEEVRQNESNPGMQ